MKSSLSDVLRHHEINLNLPGDHDRLTGFPLIRVRQVIYCIGRGSKNSLQDLSRWPTCFHFQKIEISTKKSTH